MTAAALRGSKPNSYTWYFHTRSIRTFLSRFIIDCWLNLPPFCIQPQNAKRSQILNILVIFLLSDPCRKNVWAWYCYFLSLKWLVANSEIKNRYTCCDYFNLIATVMDRSSTKINLMVDPNRSTILEHIIIVRARN